MLHLCLPDLLTLVMCAMLPSADDVIVRLTQQCALVLADADVYLLDDPLSAVDVHVGHHLMTHVLQGLLASKTRIVVTHQLQFLPNADTVMVMQDGHIQELGGYQVGIRGLCSSTGRHRRL